MGYGSGKYRRKRKNELIENTLCLKMSAIRSENKFINTGLLTLYRAKNEAVTLPYEHDGKHSEIKLCYEYDTEHYKQRIILTRTKTGYKFLCPGCSGRYSHLYCRGYFRCRNCSLLIYRSSRERRKISKAESLERGYLSLLHKLTKITH